MNNHQADDISSHSDIKMVYSNKRGRNNYMVAIEALLFDVILNRH
ncbi:MAG: hypothetical protein ACI85N_001156 [Gammaproteobacteria bacterium]|jgi:hypothetical protein